jgi:putative redox protein
LFEEGGMKIHLRGTPDFRFEAENPDNGYAFSIGASKSIGGDESGFRPMQLLLTALGSCAGIDVINILNKSRVNFTALEVEVEGDRKEGTPSPFKTIRARFIVRGHDVDRAKAEKAVSLSVEKYCSVASSLDPSIRIETVTEIKEP